MRRLLFALPLLSLLTAPLPGQPAQAKVKFQGVVVDEHDRPVAGAVVSGIAYWVTKDAANGFAKTGSVDLAEQLTDTTGGFTVELHRNAGESFVRLSARLGLAFIDRHVVVSAKAADKPIHLRISPKNARTVTIRVVDEDGQPVRGAAVAARHQPTGWGPVPHGTRRTVAWPAGKAPTTDVAGKFVSPACLDPDGRYLVEIRAKGYLPERTVWKDVPPAGPVAFADVTLRRPRTIRGEVLDRQGKPVADARVLRIDRTRRVEVKTDKAGRFTLQTAFSPLGLLFVEHEGFRFHGQVCDRSEAPRITLTRAEEPSPRRMTTLPPAGNRAERQKLAARLLEPVLEGVLEKGADDARLRPLEALARIDPGRALAELERRPFRHAWHDGFVRYAAVNTLRHASRQEAETIAESIPDPNLRVRCYYDLDDATPPGQRAERLRLLNRALVASRGVEANDHRVIHLAMIARRLWDLGEKERATKLLQEGHAIARELPIAAWAGFARAVFAEFLALIDLPGALALMKDLKDPYEYIRHHGNLAHRLAGSRPVEAERLLGLIAERGRQGANQRDFYAVRICHRMAPADLKRARALAGSIGDAYHRARALGVMAQALAKGQPKEARELLAEAFALLQRHVASGQDRFNSQYNAAAVAGLLLPAAEAIDPALVPEYFWRTLSLRTSRGDDQQGMEAASIGALALVVARYDHKLAAALVDEAEQQPRPAESARHLPAATLVDPRRAAELVEKLPAGRNAEHTRLSLVALLVAEGAELERQVCRALGQWFVEDEDL